MIIRGLAFLNALEKRGLSWRRDHFLYEHCYLAVRLVLSEAE